MKGEPMKATEILKKDHQQVKTLIRQCKESPKRDTEIMQQIYDSIKVHSRCEEEIFYPAMREFVPEKIQNAIEEHQEVDDLLEELIGLDDRKEFEEKLNELEESLLHHIREEEGALFPVAEDQLDKYMDELGSRIQKLKQHLASTQFRKAA
jgi:hemerythrin superfamily protein